MSILEPDKPRYSSELAVKQAKSLQTIQRRKWKNDSSTDEEDEDQAREEQSQIGGVGEEEQDLEKRHVQQFKPGNQGFTNDKIEKDLGRVIQCLKKGKAVVKGRVNGPGPKKKSDEIWAESNRMDVEPNEANQNKKVEKDRQSDEATSPAPQNLTLKEGSNTIAELLVALKNKWGNQEQPKVKEYALGEEKQANYNVQKVVQINRKIKANELEKSGAENTSYITGNVEDKYYVELAEDEDDTKQDLLEEEWDMKLASEIKTKLHTKRRREEPGMLLIKERGEEDGETEENMVKKARKEKAEEPHSSRLLEWKMEEDNNGDKAEEVGQHMPH
ncbi:hypothetical protein PIB30_001447 [Stylosanthes scabra]|uniref:Uncharacterized protein n=1 Tax=Stylosanthes scabra TaxID=79078 RepID=A0ABU6Q3H9_9FABA|nr:hypothetical protein [Stylosanthes scabra]